MDAERLFCHGIVINNRYNRKKGYCNQEGGYYEKDFSNNFCNSFVIIFYS